MFHGEMTVVMCEWVHSAKAESERERVKEKERENDAAANDDDGKAFLLF